MAAVAETQHLFHIIMCSVLINSKSNDQGACRWHERGGVVVINRESELWMSNRSTPSSICILCSLRAVLLLWFTTTCGGLCLFCDRGGH